MTRTIIAAGISMLIASLALGQNHGRLKSSSPTPTPTPRPSNQFEAQGNHQWPTENPPATTAQVPARSVQSIPTATSPQRTTTAAQVPARSVQSIPVATTARTTPQFPTAPAPQSNPTPTPVPPPDINAYIQRMIGNSNDQKLHLTVNGKDLALTPFHVWASKSTGPNTTSTCVDTRSTEGKVYDIDFVSTGSQVTTIKIHRINGETVNHGR